MMNVSFVPSIWIHKSIILIFIEKKYACRLFFQRKVFFSTIFDFHFRENPPFHDELQALFFRIHYFADSWDACMEPASQNWIQKTSFMG